MDSSAGRRLQRLLRLAPTFLLPFLNILPINKLAFKSNVEVFGGSPVPCALILPPEMKSLPTDEFASSRLMQF